MKIPDPIIEPITIIVESINLNSFFKVLSGEAASVEEAAWSEMLLIGSFQFMLQFLFHKIKETLIHFGNEFPF